MYMLLLSPHGYPLFPYIITWLLLPPPVINYNVHQLSYPLSIIMCIHMLSPHSDFPSIHCLYYNISYSYTIIMCSLPIQLWCGSILVLACLGCCIVTCRTGLGSNSLAHAQLGSSGSQKHGARPWHIDSLGFSLAFCTPLLVGYHVCEYTANTLSGIGIYAPTVKVLSKRDHLCSKWSLYKCWHKCNTWLQGISAATRECPMQVGGHWHCAKHCYLECSDDWWTEEANCGEV